MGGSRKRKGFPLQEEVDPEHVEHAMGRVLRVWMEGQAAEQLKHAQTGVSCMLGRGPWGCCYPRHVEHAMGRVLCAWMEGQAAEQLKHAQTGVSCMLGRGTWGCCW